MFMFFGSNAIAFTLPATALGPIMAGDPGADTTVLFGPMNVQSAEVGIAGLSVPPTAGVDSIEVSCALEAPPAIPAIARPRTSNRKMSEYCRIMDFLPGIHRLKAKNGCQIQ